MTVALGVLSGGSAILAADTELTVEDFMKTEGGKIWWSTHGDEILAVTGAGDASYLEAIYYETKDDFVRLAPQSLADFQVSLGSLIKVFHQNHIEPYACASDRPDIWLIVSARIGKAVGMWTSSKSTVRPVHRHSAVGIGEMHAREMFNLLDRRMDQTAAMALAVYAVYRIKQLVPGVGKSTHVLRFGQEGLPHGMVEEQIEELEKLFRFYNRLEGQLVHWALGSDMPFAESERVRALIDHARSKIKELLHPNRPSNSDMSQT